MRADGRPGAGGFYQRPRRFLLKPEESGREALGKALGGHADGDPGK